MLCRPNYRILSNIDVLDVWHGYCHVKTFQDTKGRLYEDCVSDKCKEGGVMMERSSLVPWRSGELTGFRREMDRLFDRFFEGWPFRVSAAEGPWVPSVDVSETAKDVVVRAELPGMDPKDRDQYE